MTTGQTCWTALKRNHLFDEYSLEPVSLSPASFYPTMLAGQAISHWQHKHQSIVDIPGSSHAAPLHVMDATQQTIPGIPLGGSIKRFDLDIAKHNRIIMTGKSKVSLGKR